jgi:hypothetical protein
MPSDSLSTANYAAVIKDLRAKRDELDRTIKMLEAMASIPANQPQEAPASRPPRERMPATTANTGIGDACARILEKAGGMPLSTREVYATLIKEGFEFNSDNPVNNVFSALSHRTKAGDIEKAGRGRWRYSAPIEKQATHQSPHQNGLAAHQ